MFHFIFPCFFEFFESDIPTKVKVITTAYFVVTQAVLWSVQFHSSELQNYSRTIAVCEQTCDDA